MKKDGTFCFKGREFKLSRFAGERVTVCLIPNEKLMAVKTGRRWVSFIFRRKLWFSPLSTFDFHGTSLLVFLD